MNSGDVETSRKQKHYELYVKYLEQRIEILKNAWKWYWKYGIQNYTKNILLGTANIIRSVTTLA